MKPFRFSVEMMRPFDEMSWAGSARTLESLGFATLFAPDHLDEGYGPITAMATAAAATTTLQVGTAVLAADFRHPAFLARELASIDELSEGRLEIGLGAGYQINDYRGSGLRMDPPGVRVSRMIEQIAVLRGLFAPGPFSFQGEHYQITELDGTPKPYRPEGPPIFVAGGGKRMLTFAARHADIIGVNPTLPTSLDRAGTGPDSLPTSIDTKLSWIKEAAGDRFDDLEIHAWLRYAALTDDLESAIAPWRKNFGADDEQITASPVVLVGDVEQIVDRLHERRERWGYSYFTLQQQNALEFAPVLARLAG